MIGIILNYNPLFSVLEIQVNQIERNTCPDQSENICVKEKIISDHHPGLWIAASNSQYNWPFQWLWSSRHAYTISNITCKGRERLGAHQSWSPATTYGRFVTLQISSTIKEGVLVFYN